MWECFGGFLKSPQRSERGRCRAEFGLMRLLALRRTCHGEAVGLR